MARRLVLLALFAALLPIERAYGQGVFASCLQELEFPSASDVNFDYTLRSYDSLFESRQYAALLLKFEHEHGDSTVVPSRENVGWVAEASYALAEIGSENADPHVFRDFLWIDEVDENDLVGHDLFHIRVSIGPNLWPERVRRKYGHAELCIAERYRIANPSFAGFFARQLATLIAMGRFEQAIALAKPLSPGDLDIDEPLGDYLAMFVDRYVGYGQYVEGARFLAAVAAAHVVSEDVFSFRSQLIFRAVEDSEFSETRKNELLVAIQVHLQQP